MATTKNDFLLQVQGFIAGIGKHYAGATLQLDGKSVTAASLVTLFQAVADAEEASQAAATQRTAAVAKAAAAVEQAKPAAKAFKAFVLAASGSDAETLADFDLKPPKVPVVTPETKAAAAKKAAATREALGTKGSQQKKAAKKALASSAAPATPAATPPATPKA
jgi:hypothetical protein